MLRLRATALSAAAESGPRVRAKQLAVRRLIGDWRFAPATAFHFTILAFLLVMATDARADITYDIGPFSGVDNVDRFMPGYVDTLIGAITVPSSEFGTYSNSFGNELPTDITANLTFTPGGQSLESGVGLVPDVTAAENLFIQGSVTFSDAGITLSQNSELFIEDFGPRIGGSAAVAIDVSPGADSVVAEAEIEGSSYTQPELMSFVDRNVVFPSSSVDGSGSGSGFLVGSPQSVPEPSALVALCGLGAIGLIVVFRKRVAGERRAEM